jgi:hypothetical protein
MKRQISSTKVDNRLPGSQRHGEIADKREAAMRMVANAPAVQGHPFTSIFQQSLT